MKRRQFISLSALVGVATVLPVSLQAEDFRQTKADVWTAHTVDDAIKNMYGDKKIIESGVDLTAPKIATNSASVPINIKSSINAKSVSIFQNANPESAVAAFTVHTNSVIDYNLNVKLKSDGSLITIKAIVEDIDGNLYSATKTITVAIGTCDG